MGMCIFLFILQCLLVVIYCPQIAPPLPQERSVLVIVRRNSGVNFWRLLVISIGLLKSVVGDQKLGIHFIAPSPSREGLDHFLIMFVGFIKISFALILFCQIMMFLCSLITHPKLYNKIFVRKFSRIDVYGAGFINNHYSDKIHFNDGTGKGITTPSIRTRKNYQLAECHRQTHRWALPHRKGKENPNLGQTKSTLRNQWQSFFIVEA